MSVFVYVCAILETLFFWWKGDGTNIGKIKRYPLPPKKNCQTMVQLFQKTKLFPNYAIFMDSFLDKKSPNLIVFVLFFNRRGRPNHFVNTNSDNSAYRLPHTHTLHPVGWVKIKTKHHLFLAAIVECCM